MMTDHDKCTFELLSAYLDGEVTAQQRQEIQELLSNDPEIQELYRRLLYLRQEINNLPVPSPSYSVQDLTEGVFAKIDQEKKQRQIWLWGGTAIAATVLATVSGVFMPQRPPLLQMANENNNPEEHESLIIALNEPVIEIPQKEENLMIPLDHSLMDIIQNK